MTAADFRRIALSLEGVEEYSHGGLPAFRVGGRKFASLASQAEVIFATFLFVNWQNSLGQSCDCLRLTGEVSEGRIGEFEFLRSGAGDHGRKDE